MVKNRLSPLVVQLTKYCVGQQPARFPGLGGFHGGAYCAGSIERPVYKSRKSSPSTYSQGQGGAISRSAGPIVYGAEVEPKSRSPNRWMRLGLASRRTILLNLLALVRGRRWGGDFAEVSHLPGTMDLFVSAFSNFLALLRGSSSPEQLTVIPQRLQRCLPGCLDHCFSPPIACFASGGEHANLLLLGKWASFWWEI